MKKTKSLKVIAIILCGLLIFQQTGFAQVASVELNIAGHIASFHNTFFPEKFRPLHLRSVSYDELNNDFKLLLDKGDEQKLKKQDIELTAKDLLNYFFVGIALPNDAFWVNLRPDSPNDIIDPFLAQTEVGKIFLEADLQLKKDAANATNPQTIEGKEYWDKLYRKAAEIYGTQEVTIPTLTRPWIVPDEVIIRESTNSAYVYKATLKVMLEQDYLKGNAAYSFRDEREKQLNEYSTQLIKEDIIPKLTKEINTAKRYAPLRQVYYSLILAQWFKARNQNKNTQYAERIDRKDLTSLQAQVPYSVSTYFNAYKESFAKGEYNIKAPVSTPYGQVIRSYFSGGISVTALVAPALGELSSGAVAVLPDANAYLPKSTDLAAVASANGEVSLTGPSAGQVLASPEETLDEEYARLNSELWNLDPKKDAAKLGPIKKRMREIDNKLRPVDLSGSSAGQSGFGQGNGPGPGGMEKPEDAAARASLPSLDELPLEAQQNVKNSIEGLKKDMERLENAVREFESASSKQMVMEDGSRRDIPGTLVARLEFNFPGLVDFQTKSSIPSITDGRSIDMAEYLVTQELIAAAESLNKMMPDWLARIKNKDTAEGGWLSWMQMGAVEQQMSIIPFQSLIAARLRDQKNIEDIDQAFGKGQDLLIHSASPEVISKILERDVLASRLQQRKRFGEDVQSTALLSNRAMPKGTEEELNQVVFGYNQWFTGYGAFAIILPARPVLANNQFSEWDGIHVFDLNNQGFAQDLFAIPFVLVAAPEGESEIRSMLQKYAERLLADNPDLDISSWVENHIKVLPVDSLKPTLNSSGVNTRRLSDQEQNEIWAMMQRQSNANTLVPQAGHFLPTGKREKMFKNMEQEQYIYHINAQQALSSPDLDKRVLSSTSLNVAEGIERREDAARRNAIDRIKNRIEDYQVFEQLIGGIINKLEAGQPLSVEDISVLNEFKDRIILKNSLVALYLKTHPGDVIVVSNQPAIKFLNTIIGEPATNRLIELRQKTATRLLLESGLVRSEDKSTLSLLFKQDKFVIEAEVVSQLGSAEISKKLNWVAQRLSAELTEFLHREYKDNAAIQDFVFVSQFGASLPVKNQTDDAYILADIQAVQAAKMARRLSQPERIFNYQELDSLMLQAAEFRQELGLGREEMPSEDEMKTVRGKTVENLELEVRNGASGAQRQLQLKKYLEILDLFDYQKSWRPSPVERTEQASAIFSVLGRLDRVIQNRDSPEDAVASLRKALSVIKANPKNSKIVSGEAFLANAAKLLEEEDVVLIAMDVVGFWSDMQKHFSAAHQESMKIPVYRAEDGLRMSILILIADDLVKRKMSERLNALIKVIGEDIPILNADGTDLMLINQEGGDEIVFAVRKHDWNALATKLSNQNLGVRVIANSISSVGKRPGQSDQTLLGRAYTNVAHDVFGEAYVTTQESDKKAKDLEKLGVFSAVISLEANEQGAPEWFVYYKGKRVAYDEFLEKQIEEMKALGVDSKLPSADESGATGSPSQPYTNAVARDVVRPLLLKGEEEQLKILDVGSGSGITSVAAALFGGEDVNVTGLEPDKNNVDLSNRVKQYAGNLDREGLFDRSGDVETYVEELESSGEVPEPVDNVEFRVGSATLIPYADNSFNRIIYFDVNSFILKANDRAKAIQEILRVIDKKKGGLIHAHPKASAVEKDLQEFIEAFNIEADKIGLKLEYRFTSSTESGRAILFIIQPGSATVSSQVSEARPAEVVSKQETTLRSPDEIETVKDMILDIPDLSNDDIPEAGVNLIEQKVRLHISPSTDTDQNIIKSIATSVQILNRSFNGGYSGGRRIGYEVAVSMQEHFKKRYPQVEASVLSAYNLDNLREEIIYPAGWKSLVYPFTSGHFIAYFKINNIYYAVDAQEEKNPQIFIASTFAGLNDMLCLNYGGWGWKVHGATEQNVPKRRVNTAGKIASGQRASYGEQDIDVLRLQNQLPALAGNIDSIMNVLDSEMTLAQAAGSVSKIKDKLQSIVRRYLFDSEDTSENIILFLDYIFKRLEEKFDIANDDIRREMIVVIANSLWSETPQNDWGDKFHQSREFVDFMLRHISFLAKTCLPYARNALHRVIEEAERTKGGRVIMVQNLRLGGMYPVMDADMIRILEELGYPVEEVDHETLKKIESDRQVSPEVLARLQRARIILVRAKLPSTPGALDSSHPQLDVDTFYKSAILILAASFGGLRIPMVMIDASKTHGLSQAQEKAGVEFIKINVYQGSFAQDHQYNFFPDNEEVVLPASIITSQSARKNQDVYGLSALEKHGGLFSVFAREMSRLMDSQLRKDVGYYNQHGRFPSVFASDNVQLTVSLATQTGIEKSGGIDFRFLPIVTQSIGSLKASIKSIPASSLQQINLTQEWADIQRLVNSGITPSTDRLKEYFAASCYKGNSGSDAERIVSCIAGILRSEEASCVLTDPVLKDILVVLGSGRSLAELKSAFTI